MRILGRFGILRDPVSIDEIAEKYRKGIAEFLGVPEEWIREDVARKWARHFVEAFIKPEYLDEAIKGMTEAHEEIMRSVGRR